MHIIYKCIKATSVMKDINIVEAITRWATRQWQLARNCIIIWLRVYPLWYHISSSKSHTKTIFFQLSRPNTARLCTFEPRALIHSHDMLDSGLHGTYNPLPSVDYERKQMNTRYTRINIYTQKKCAGNAKLRTRETSCHTIGWIGWETYCQQSEWDTSLSICCSLWRFVW